MYIGLNVVTIVAINNMNIESVAMEKQNIPFALLSICKILRSAVNIKVITSSEVPHVFVPF
jgi:hypothetical protein